MLSIAGAIQFPAFAAVASDTAPGFSDPAEEMPAAQDSNAKATGEDKTKSLDTVKVVGSQIAGGGAQAASAIVTLDNDQIEATGATNGNDLVRSLPQMGDVTWNPTWLGGGSQNAARGDVGSISLRGIGASNTLLLINGRRSVIHPTTSTVDGALSTTTYNSNAIPMYGLERLDILLDGAAALYGSDAVAGVVNVVTRQDMPSGGGVQVQFGQALSTGRKDVSLDGYFGHDFAGGRGNITVMYDYTHNSPEYASDEWYTATSRRRKLADGSYVPDPTGVASGLSTATPYGQFRQYSGGSPVGPSNWYINADGVATAGTFPKNTLGVDSASNPGITLSPRLDRSSVFANWRYDLTDNTRLYGELSWYQASTTGYVSPSTTSSTQPVYIDVNSPVVPEALKTNGADAIYLGSNYLAADGGIRPVKDDNYQYRFLIGLKGTTDNGWNWDTGLLWSQSHVNDVMTGMDVSAFVDAVNSGVYNPFNGGGTVNGGDTTPSNASAFMIDVYRRDTAQLGLWDFKVDRPDLFSWYAGDIGMAAGVEVRYESLRDNRDPHIDGTIKYTDWYTGKTYDSDFASTSSTPDSYGSRNVKSVFAEFAIPFVSPEMGIPLVKSLDMQLAGRYEKYSDVGDVAKPKIGLAWQVFDSLLLRGSFAEGFKAPNLELVNSSVLYRFNGYNDAVRCIAMENKGDYANYNSCIASVNSYTNQNVNYSIRSVRTGNKDLKPELSRNASYGFVFEPKFIPQEFGRFSFSVDWWKITIDNPIGTLSDQDALYYDAYLRATGQGSNPNVIRAAPIDTDQAQFAGSGLDAVGVVDHVNATYENMSPLTAKGIDYNLGWKLRGTRFGDFSVNIQASQLKDYAQEPPKEDAEIQAALDSGLLPQLIGIPTVGATNLVGLYTGYVGIKPEWRYSATLVWGYKDWKVRIRDQFIDNVTYSGVLDDAADYIAPSTQIWNASVRKDFSEGQLKGWGVEVGVNNAFDKDPPLDYSGGYLASLYQPYGRYVYANIQYTW